MEPVLFEFKDTLSRIQFFSNEKSTRLEFSGSFTPIKPLDQIQEFIQSIHEHMVESKIHEVVVDLLKLDFMNSQAIRFFLTWLGTLNQSTYKYHVIFHCNDNLPWQELLFDQMKFVLPDLVQIKIIIPRIDQPI